jgi:hypothetical protein
MLQKGEYEEIYRLLLPEIRENKIDKGSKKYFYFLVSLYHRDNTNTLFEPRFIELIKEKNVAAVQRVIDYLGDELIKTYFSQGRNELLSSLLELEGLTFNEQQGYYLSFFIFNNIAFENDGLLNNSDSELFKKAMELRGEREEIDRIYLVYHYYFGDKEKAIENFPLASIDCQNYFFAIFFNRKFRPLLTLESFNDPFERGKYIDALIKELDEMELSREMERHFITYYYAILNYLKDLLSIEEYEKLTNISIFKNSPLLEIFTLLRELKNIDNQEMVQSELKKVLDRDCQEIEDLREILEIVINGTPIYNLVSVNNGILQVERENNLQYYNIFTGEKLNIDTQYVPYGNRTYYYFVGYKYNNNNNWRQEYALLDGNYNIIHNFGDEILTVLWLDHSKLVYTDKSSKRRVFDIESRTFIDYDDRYVKEIKETKEYNHISNIVIDGDYYGFYTFDGIYRYYLIREIATNKEVARYKMDFYFLEDDRDYIYGFEYFANIRLLVALNKETLEKKVLPFYMIQLQGGPQQ